MFSRLTLTLRQRLSSLTSLHLSSSLPTRTTKDYEYIKMIETADPLQAYNLLVESHLKGIVLDIPVFNTVYQKTQHLDDTYHQVLHRIYLESFRNSAAINPLLTRLKLASPLPQPSKLSPLLPHSEKKHLEETQIEQQPKLNKNQDQYSLNPQIQQLMDVLKEAAKSRSNLLISNIELSFDYNHLYGNPLANEGLEEYGNFTSVSQIQPDPQDILSCLKEVKIGDILLQNPETKCKQ